MNCEVCGQRVKVSTSTEGTSSYEPVAEQECASVRQQLADSERRVDLYAKANAKLVRVKEAAERALEAPQWVESRALADLHAALADLERPGDMSKKPEKTNI